MAETKKYVRIKKAKFLRNWYSAYIGRMYIVIGENESEYITHVGDVLKEDAELIVTEKRPAKVGERVLITEAYAYTGCPYKNGDINNVKTADKHGHILVEEHSVSLLRREYEVIVNNEVENEEADEMESVNQTAIDTASTVFEKVGEGYIGSKSRFGDILIGAPYSEAFVKAYANERKDVLVIPQTIEYTAFLHNEEMKKVATHGQAPIVSAQARRDEIVEQAKADVAKLIEDAGSSVRVGYGNFTLRHRMSRVEFVVNREKRTVVALVFGKIPRFRNELREKGIAKATPDDCFNVHIGKSIALRRALGLAVPDECLNAPQPTEVRVGDVIEVTLDSGEIEKKPVISLKAGSLNAHLPGRIIQYPSHYAKIIDDSREEVGGE
ncbi:hypothetical protein [Bacillus velezensis]|uniref:hypothetical protein n=1 Tax=Bacillus velezensis TaxID=492670 RepID=UPI000470ABCB|nr:hypothetical protein [Bacillus velezensis]